MTTRTLTGKYTAGYTLKAVYSTLSLTSGAYVGGSGLTIQTPASVVNAGHVGGFQGAVGAGGFSGGAGSGGGVAMTLTTGDALTNASGGLVAGGSGGGGGDAIQNLNDNPEEGAGGAGGSGAVALSAGGATAILNRGAIAAGGGGKGGYSLYLGGNGGAGGAALGLQAAAITNYSAISGGGGGQGGTSGGYLSNHTQGGTGGSGGVGIAAAGAVTLVNSGRITGGAGGVGGNSYQNEYDDEGISAYGSGGNGGVAVNLAGGGTITNSGTINGGTGGNATGHNTGGEYDAPYNSASSGGNGGAGVVLGGNGVISNTGFIGGGAGGGNADHYGSAADGIDANSANDTITTSGTISGADSVRLSTASDRLIVQNGATFIGVIAGGGGTLELGAFSEGTGLGATGTLSIDISGTFSGFGAYVLDAGVELALSGHNAITATDTFTAGGELLSGGTFVDAGLVSVSATGEAIAYGIFDVTGSLANAGHMVGGRGSANTISTPGYAALTETGGSVTNSGTITGGVGGYGAFGYAAGGGGGGGAGVVEQGGAFTSSGGALTGGAGGHGGNGSTTEGAPTTTGGAGGAGVLLQGGTFTDSGARITGGAGGAGGVGTSPGGAGGSGGAGAYVVGGTLINAGGTIAGGAGGAGQSGAANGAAGDGVILATSFPGGQVVNKGLITGVVAVYGRAASFATITDYGTLQGSGGVAVQFRSGNDRLKAEAGSTFLGVVQGGGATLELASGTGTIAGLGSAGTVSGAEAMAISGFGLYQVDAGTSWTLSGGDTLSANQTLTNFGTLSGALALGSASDRLVSEAGSAISAAPVAGNGGTLELTAATGTITGLGKTGTVSGGESLTFKGQSAGFGVYLLDAGGAWTFSGASTITAGRGLVVNGCATVTGALTASGSITVAGSLVNDGSIGAPGAGIVLTSGGQLTNAAGSTIGGPRGIYVGHYDQATVTNFGTIVGSSQDAVQFRNIHDRLIVESGAVFVGAVAAYQGTLELAQATGTITGLGTKMSASDATGAFSGFEVYELDGGGVWTLAGSNSLGQGDVGIDAGATLTNTGSLYLGGAIGDFGSFINQGTVNAGGAAGTELYIAGSGQLTNAAGGTLIGWIGLATSGLNPLTVTNAGTIDGTGGMAVTLESSKDRLIVASGASFIGAVQGGGAALEIPFSGATITGLGSAMTVSGVSGTFSGFGLYLIDAGVSVTTVGTDRLSNHATLIGAGILLNKGNLSGYQGAQGGGGFSGGTGSAGGPAVSLTAGSSLSNYGVGVIAGGGGGGGGDAIQNLDLNPEEGAGGSGGVGAGALSATGAAAIRNRGSILGGGGGTALSLQGAGAAITNYSAIAAGGGGQGGTSGGYLSNDTMGGVGGGGGTGVAASGAITLVNSGRITGGAGGTGGNSYQNEYNDEGISAYGSGGNGGAGANLSGGGTITNSGTIQGGGGGNATGTNGGDIAPNPLSHGGNGGAGVVLGAGGALTNSGFIGGGGAGGGGDVNGSAADGVDANGANDTITTSGTVSGADSVRLSTSSDRLIVQSKAKFNGVIAGGGGALELATGSDTITGLGGAGTLSGAASGIFGGFGSYFVDAGATLTLIGAASVGAHALFDGGSLVNAGTLNASGVAVTLVGAGQLSNKAGARIQATIGAYAGAGTSATLTNAGTIQGSTASVQFKSSGDELIAQSGAMFIGAIQGGGGTLALGGGSDTITGLGGAGTLSGSASGTFSAFTTILAGVGATLAVTSAQTLAGGETLSIAGTLSNSATLTDNGALFVSGSAANNGALVDNGLVSITASGTLGAGVLVVTGSLANAGHVVGAAGSGSGVAGAAAFVETAGSVFDSGTIVGGAGAAGSTTVAGGAGGVGVVLRGGALTTAAGQYIGSAGGLIVGGQGGAAPAGASVAAGAGGAGVYVLGGLVDNGGTLAGGQAGAGGLGAAGGDGVVLAGGNVVNADGAVISGAIGVYGLAGSAATVANSGLVEGSSGVAVEFRSASDRLIDQAIPGGPFNGAVLAGTYFQGVVLGGGGTLELSSGTGRIGALGSEYSGFGAYVVDAGGTWNLYYSNTIAGGHTLTNMGALDLIGSLSNQGSIAGAGAGVALTNYETQAGYGLLTNGGAADRSASITGVVGVYGAAGSVGTVTNFGTIDGTGGVAVRFASAQDRLVAEAGATFIGTAQGGGGTLEFATAGGTISGLGGTGTLSGPAALTFSGFGAYVLDPGATWTVSGASLGPNVTLANYGTLSSALTLGSASDRVIAGGGAVFSGKLAGGGGTLELAPGVGTIALGGAKISGFGAYRIDAHGSWTLTGSANTGGADMSVVGALALAGSLTTNGAITGGAGVNGQGRYDPTTPAGDGVEALSVLAGSRLTNGGSISGGAGGRGYGSSGVGETGGMGALGVAGTSASVSNSGRIAGGAGGVGGAGYYAVGFGGLGGIGGAGGVGVSLAAATLANSGVIAGGAGGAGGLSAGYYTGGDGGNGGAAITLAGGLVTNTGTLLGGAGGAGGGDSRRFSAGYGAAGYSAYAISVSGGGTIVNGAAAAKKALISGRIGVADGGGGSLTVTNFGTIKGTGGTSVRFASAGDRLIAEASSHFVGAIQGGGGVLELAGAGGETITALGAAGAMSGALSASVAGFGSFVVDSGIGLTVIGSAQVDQIATLADYGAVTLASGQTLQASGLVIVAGSLNVAGVVDGPSGSGQPDGAGLGVELLTGGQVIVSGAVSAGEGQSNVAVLYGAGGAGGSGVSGVGAGTVTVNGGAITAAGGGAGYYGGGPEAGGAGGAGVALAGGAVALNGGTIAGGAGGGGVRYYDQGGSGGAGGAGVGFAGGGTVTNTAGTIRGGAGGAGGRAGYYGGSGGAGGAGVATGDVGTVVNGAGAIIGGAGGAGGYGGLRSGSAGQGGDGVLLGAGGLVVNGAPGVPTALIEGFVGVYAGGGGAATLTNFGVIEGTGGVSVLLGSSADRLIVEAGSSFIGLAQGGGGTLELAGGSGTITSLGASGTLTRASSLTFAGFGAYRIDAGASWLLQGANVLAAGQSLSVAGVLSVGAKSEFTVQGVVVNSGSITLAGAAKAASLIVGAAGATLSGAGTVALSANLNIVKGANAAVILTNIDNTITGAGLLGDGKLVLVNDAAGVIDATGAKTLTINTGTKAVTNAGTIETTGSGGLTITGAVNNAGVLEALKGTLTLGGAVTGTGSAVIGGGALNAVGAFSQNVTFGGGAGKLELASSQTFAGTVTGFSKTGATALDLRDIGFVSASEATFSGTKAGGVLTVSDGAHTAKIALAGNYLAASFAASSDGQGGVIIVDMPTPPMAPVADAFVAAMAGMGAAAASGAAFATARDVGHVTLLARPGGMIGAPHRRFDGP